MEGGKWKWGGGKGEGGYFSPARVFIEQVSKKCKTFLSFTAYVKPATLNPTFEESSVKMFFILFLEVWKGNISAAHFWGGSSKETGA